MSGRRFPTLGKRFPFRLGASLKFAGAARGFFADPFVPPTAAAPPVEPPDDVAEADGVELDDAEPPSEDPPLLLLEQAPRSTAPAVKDDA